MAKVSAWLLKSSGRKDEDFRKTIEAAWHDYTAKTLFNPETDVFGIITLRGSDSMLSHFANLLDCARFSLDAADFKARLDTPGLLNKKARHYCEEVQVFDFGAFSGTY